MVSTSRKLFYERIRIFNQTLNNAILIDNSLTNDDHNERARFLRNGLAITSFNILEDFLKNRIGEILNIISGSGINFNTLPENIQEISLLNALSGVYKVSKRKKDNQEDWKLFIQEETGKLSSTQSSNFNLSKYSIGWENSNLSTSDLEKFWSVFKIGDLWNQAYNITFKIGQTVSFPRQFFQNAAMRRHAAAHDPAFAASFSDLESYGRFVKSFALSLDFLISQSARLIIDRNPDYLSNPKKKITHDDINLRFVKKISTVYKEMSVNNSTSIANFTTIIDAVSSIRNRINYQNEMIIVSDLTTNDLFWFTGL